MDENTLAGLSAPIEDDQFIRSVLRYIDGLSSAEEAESLAEQLRSDANRRLQFVDICRFCCEITEKVQPTRFASKLSAADGGDAVDEVLKACLEILPVVTSEREHISEHVQGVSGTVASDGSSNGRQVGRSQTWGGSFSRTRWMVAVAAVLLVGLFIWPRWVSQSKVVVTVVSATDSAALLMKKGDTLESGTRVTIEKGQVEFETDLGVRVALSAPVACTWEAANSVVLDHGTAQVLAPVGVSGFEVKTKVAKIVDLGTEFGVTARRDNSVEVAVLQGEVEVSTRQGIAEGDEPCVVVAAGSLCRINASGEVGQQLREIVATPGWWSSPFYDQALSLADMVAGGDGLGEAQAKGIDPVSGRIVEVDSITHIGALDIPEYLPVDESPWIDGVFQPAEGKFVAVIDSTGRQFRHDRLYRGLTFGPIWSGAPAPVHRPLGPKGENQVSSTIAGIDYGRPPHTILFMHPNKGITFDLEAIRKAHPGVVLDRFTGLLGNTEQAELTRPEESKSRRFAADFWVLIDGETVVERFSISQEDGVIPLEVFLPEDSKFLTLIAGQGPDGLSLDWIVLVDAYLRMYQNSGITH